MFRYVACAREASDNTIITLEDIYTSMLYNGWNEEKAPDTASELFKDIYTFLSPLSDSTVFRFDADSQLDTEDERESRTRLRAFMEELWKLIGPEDQIAYMNSLQSTQPEF